MLVTFSIGKGSHFFTVSNKDQDWATITRIDQEIAVAPDELEDFILALTTLKKLLPKSREKY